MNRASQIVKTVALALLLGAFVSANAVADEVLKNPRIIIFKSKRILDVYSGSNLVKTYRAGLGSNPIGPKRQAGDRATPEGNYFVCGKNPSSTYSMAFVLSYPNGGDAERGLAAKSITKEQYSRIQAAGLKMHCPPFDTALGGEIEVHGMGSNTDWTWGCIALDTDDIKELYPKIPVGTPVTIEP